MKQQVDYAPGPTAEPYTCSITYRGKLPTYDQKLEKFGVSPSELTTFHLRLRNFVRPLLRQEDVYFVIYIFLFVLFFAAFSLPVLGHILWILGFLWCSKRHSKIKESKIAALKSFLEEENFKKWGPAGLMWHTDAKVKKLTLDFASYGTPQMP